MQYVHYFISLGWLKNICSWLPGEPHRRAGRLHLLRVQWAGISRGKNLWPPAATWPWIWLSILRNVLCFWRNRWEQLRRGWVFQVHKMLQSNPSWFVLTVICVHSGGGYEWEDDLSFEPRPTSPDTIPEPRSSPTSTSNSPEPPKPVAVALNRFMVSRFSITHVSDPHMGSATGLY